MFKTLKTPFPWSRAVHIPGAGCDADADQLKESWPAILSDEAICAVDIEQWNEIDMKKRVMTPTQLIAFSTIIYRSLQGRVEKHTTQTVASTANAPTTIVQDHTVR